MKTIYPLTILMIVVIGCSRFAGTPAKNTAANSTSPGSAGKVIDMPSLVGRSPEVIKRIVGDSPRFETPYLSFDLPEGTLTVDYMKAIQTNIAFETSGPGVDTPEKLGNMVGIDVHGLNVPEPSDDYYFYRDVKAGDQTLKTVSFRSVGGKFKLVSIDTRP